MFPHGLLGGTAQLANGVEDLALVADNPIFHGEWGEHLAWADRIRRGEVQGRDFFCLYGPLFELSLVGTWQVFGRSLASFSLWQGLIYGLGMLAVLTLGAGLVRQRFLLLALPLLVTHVSLRIGLPLAGIGCLVAWRSSGDWRWCATAGAVAGTALFLSQEFGLAFCLVAVLAFALSAERRPALAFGLGLGTVSVCIGSLFAIWGGLGPMLADLLSYPAYVSIGYGNLPFPRFFSRLPLALIGSDAEWEMKLRLAYAMPAIAAGTLLLCLPLEFMQARRPLLSLQRLREHLLADPQRLGIAATGLFGLLCFRVALGRSDLPHLLQVTAPAALLLCVGFDRCLTHYRNADGDRWVAIWWAALLLLVTLQSGLLNAAEPLRAAGRAANGFRQLFEPAAVQAPDERVAWLMGWFDERDRPGEPLLALPNLASYYYLLDRENPTRFALSAMIVTDAHRSELLRDLRARPPSHVISDERGMRIDGLRDHLVLGEETVQWLQKHYRPVEQRMGLTILEPRPGAFGPGTDRAPSPGTLDQRVLVP
jgi:hypothetical protein